MSEAPAVHGARAWFGLIKSDMRELAREATGLIKQFRASTTMSRRGAILLASGFVVVLIGAIFLCLTIVHVLAWAFPEQPAWLWYAAVGLMLSIAGGVLLAIGRHEIEPLKAVQTHTKAVANDAKETANHVSQALHSAQDSIHQTADSVRESVNVKRQYDKRPWAILASAAAAGYVGGKLLKSEPVSAGVAVPNGTGKSKSVQRRKRRSQRKEANSLDHQSRVRRRTRAAQFAQRFQPELAHLKGLALGTLFGMIRDAATKKAPPLFENEIKEVMDGLTEKIGGTPIATPSSTYDVPNPR